jgi:hypothetical protein
MLSFNVSKERSEKSLVRVPARSSDRHGYLVVPLPARNLDVTPNVTDDQSRW